MKEEREKVNEIKDEENDYSKKEEYEYTEVDSEESSEEEDDDGKKEIRDFCDFGLTLDEGIGDGFYFIKAVNFLEYLLKNPKLLEGPANEKIEVK